MSGGRIFLLDSSRYYQRQMGVSIPRPIIGSTSGVLRLDLGLHLVVNARKGLRYILEV